MSQGCWVVVAVHGGEVVFSHESDWSGEPRTSTSSATRRAKPLKLMQLTNLES